MGVTVGFIAIAIAAVMIFFGRARHGVERPWFRVWIVGIAYIMAAMTFFIVGVASLIFNWPWW